MTVASKDGTPNEHYRVRIDDVGKRFHAGNREVLALDGVSVTVHEREFVALLGPSGCGKSTLVRITAGLESPSSGAVRISLRPGENTALAVVFQDYSILPWKTAIANIAFGMRMRGYPRKEAYETAARAMRTMGLAGFEHAYPAQLSGGMKQRVSLARAMVLDPALLLLDEPFAALDAQMRELLQEDMLALWQGDHARTAISVTHDIDEALLLSDRIVLMTHGPGRIKRIFDVPFPRPRTPDIRRTPEYGELRAEIWECLKEEVTSGGAGHGR